MILMKLPEEILCQILILSTIGKKTPSYIAQKVLNKKDLETKAVANVLTLNRRFFHLLAPHLYHKKYHAIINLTSTRYMKYFRSSADYIKLTRSDEFLKHGYEDGISGIDQKEPARIFSDNLSPLECFNNTAKTEYDLSQKTDYELLDIDPLQSDEEYNDLSFRDPDLYVFDAPGRINDLLFFCENVINNNHSTMKQFVKSFTVDIIFTDEFQTARTSKETLFGSILKKYVPAGSLSIRTTPFKAFTNFISSTIALNHIESDNKPTNITGAIHDDPRRDRYRKRVSNNRIQEGDKSCTPELLAIIDAVYDDYYYQKRNDIIDPIENFRSNYISRLIHHTELPCFNQIRKYHWRNYKTRILWSCFVKYMSSGERYNLSSLTSKKDIKSSLENIFEDFRPCNKYGPLTIDKNIDLSVIDSLDLLSEDQNICCQISHRVACYSHERSLFWNKSQRVFTSGLFFTRDQTSNLLEEVIKAVTVNSSDHINTSLIAMSLKNNTKNLKKGQAFENLKPKMIVVNKPATVPFPGYQTWH